MKDGTKQCFYCDSPLSRGNIQMDHFPIPKECGGVEVVPVCVTCHDMKDRYPIGEWPTELAIKAVGSFHSLSREARILLAKAMAAMARENARMRSAA